MIKAYISRLESGASCWYKAPIVFYLSLLSAVIIPVKFLPSSYWNSTFVINKAKSLAGVEKKQVCSYFLVLFISDPLQEYNMGWACFYLDCSIREICAKEDIDIAYKHFKAFYQSFSSVDKMLTVDTWELHLLRKCWW